MFNKKLEQTHKLTTVLTIPKQDKPIFSWLTSSLTRGLHIIKMHESEPKYGHGEWVWGHVFLQFFFFFFQREDTICIILCASLDLSIYLGNLLKSKHINNIQDIQIITRCLSPSVSTSNNYFGFPVDTQAISKVPAAQANHESSVFSNWIT